MQCVLAALLATGFATIAALPEVLRSYLPAFMSLGTGLGIALHSLLYR